MSRSTALQVCKFAGPQLRKILWCTILRKCASSEVRFSRINTSSYNSVTFINITVIKGFQELHPFTLHISSSSFTLHSTSHISIIMHHVFLQCPKFTFEPNWTITWLAQKSQKVLPAVYLWRIKNNRRSYQNL